MAPTTASITLPSSWPRRFLLAAVGARTKRIEIGTAVIDMRYENPLYMAEDAGAADLIAGAASADQSACSPEQVIDGFRTSATSRRRTTRSARRWPASTPRFSSRC